MKAIVFVHRPEPKYFGRPVIDIPASDLEATLKRHPLWTVLNLRDEEPETKDTSEAPQSDKLECPICGIPFKTEQGLKLHKTKKHS